MRARSHKRGGIRCMTRRWSVAAAAAATVAGLAVHAPAATDRWVGGDTANNPNDYNDGNNWSLAAPPGAADIAFFNAPAAYQPTLTADATTGELDFNTAGWQLGGTNTLSLQGVGGIGILSAPTTGTNEIGASLNIAAPQAWDIATGGTLQVDGTVGGSAAWSVGAAGGYGGTVLLTNANTYSGTLSVNAGTFELGGATVSGNVQYGSLQSLAGLNLNAGTFLVNNTGSNGGAGNQSGRINPSLSMAFSGGSFVYQGSNTTTSTDSAGAVTMYSGPTGVFTVNGNDGPGSAVFTIASLNQYYYGLSSAPLYTGSLLVNGTNLGSTGGSLLVSSAPYTYGATQGTNADTPGVYNTSIVPFVLGEVASGPNGAPGPNGAGGTTFGTPNTFLTYSPTTGFRPLNPMDEFAPSVNDGSTGGTSTLNDNVYITSSQTAVLSGGGQINSLVMNGAGTGTNPMLSIPDGATLTVGSGAVLFATSGAIQPSGPNGTGTLDFSTGNVNLTVNPGTTATIGTPVTGSGTSMTVSGGGTLVFNAPNNGTTGTTFNDGVMANASTVTFANGWVPTSALPTVLMTAVNGTFNFNGASVFPAPSGVATNIWLSNSALNDNGSVTFTAASANYLVTHVGQNAAINVGNATGAPVASFTVPDPNGWAFNAYGGVGYLNVYKNATLNVQGANPGTNYASLNGKDELRFASDSPGADILNVNAGATANVFALLLGDNGTTTPTPGILGAVYLQPGTSASAPGGILNITNSVTESAAPAGTSSYGVFAIGDGGSGNGKPGLNNDFGYVSVPSFAYIGGVPNSTPLATPYIATGVPAAIDVGGSYRTATNGVAGGNGLLDINGGYVTVNAYLSIGSTKAGQGSQDQQFGVVNVLNGGTLTINGYGQSGNKYYFAGQSNVAMAEGIYGSYAVLNVVNGTFNNVVSNTNFIPQTSPGSGENYQLYNSNEAINLAGVTAGGGSQNSLETNGLLTGILNINAAGVGAQSIVRTGYIRAGNITFAGSTPSNSAAGAATGYISGSASAYLNFSGGTLQNDGAGNEVGFVQNSIAGAYVWGTENGLYNGGANIGVYNMLTTTYANVPNPPPAPPPPVAPSTPAPNGMIGVGLFAAPGQGISSIAITNGGGGYLTPPIVQITDATGFDASGYATVSNGVVTGVVITSPGFNMTHPTITFVGGGGTGAQTSYALANNTSGGLAVNYSNNGYAGVLTLNGAWSTGQGGTNASLGSAKAGDVIYSLNADGTQAADATTNGAGGPGTGNDPYASGMFYGFVYDGIRNNTSTYTGPTVVQTGTLQLQTTGNAAVKAYGNSVNQFGPNVLPATNNNIPFSPAIVVGDTRANAAASLDVSTIGGTGGFQLSPGLTNGIYTSAPQVLAGFGTVKGSSTVGLTVGLAAGSTSATAYNPASPNATLVASSGNNFGGYLFANGTTSAPSVNNSTIAPGYASSAAVVPITSNAGFYQASNPTYGNGASGGGPVVFGTTTAGAPAFTFSTHSGTNAYATGALTVTAVGTISASNAVTLTLGAGGTYFWKLDTTNGGSGATPTPGLATASPAASATTTVPAVGAAWDELLLNELASGTATGSNAFTIQGFAFASGQPVAGGSSIPLGANNTMPPASYSWVIAQAPGPVQSVSGLQSLLANFSLNTSALPTPAAGYSYFLTAQQDPSVNAADLVVNYAPAPEPTGLALFGAAAGAMLLRRRKQPA